MNKNGWVFADVLIAVAILSLALSLLYPVLGSVQRLEGMEETTMRAAMEAPALDVWQDYR